MLGRQEGSTYLLCLCLRVLTVPNCAAFLCAVLQIQNRLDDPLGAEQGKCISHATGVKKMLKQLQEELYAMPSPSTVTGIVGERIVLPVEKAAA
jgi:hypothetical protein